MFWRITLFWAFLSPSSPPHPDAYNTVSGKQSLQMSLGFFSLGLLKYQVLL